LPFYYKADGLQDQPFNFSIKISNNTSSTVGANQFLMSYDFFMLSVCLKSHLPPQSLSFTFHMHYVQVLVVWLHCEGNTALAGNACPQSLQEHTL